MEKATGLDFQVETGAGLEPAYTPFAVVGLASQPPRRMWVRFLGSWPLGVRLRMVEEEGFEPSIAGIKNRCPAR